MAQENRDINDDEFDLYLKSLIEKYDVPASVREIKGKDNRGIFWESVVNENSRLKKLLESIKEKGSAEIEAEENIRKMSIFTPAYDLFVMPEMDEDISYLMNYIGISPDICSVHVYIDDRPGASTGLTTDGRFAVYVNGGLMDLFKSDADLLEPAIVNQIIHGLLKHHLSTEYELAKKKRKLLSRLKSKFLNGKRESESKIEINGYLPIDDSEELTSLALLTDDTKRYLLSGYKYIAADDIEADLAAYRYFDQIEGDGAMYIEYLRCIHNYERESGLFESAQKIAIKEGLDRYVPSSMRLILIQYAAEHPEIGKLKN